MTDNIYGFPPEDIVGPTTGARQFSPLVPGSEPLEAVEPGSLETLTILGPPGTIERRYAIALGLRALKPGGRVFFVDEAASDEISYTPTDAEDRQRRTLDDGRTFTIVKRYYDPKELAERLTGLGWQVSIARTSRHFLFGTARVRLALRVTRPRGSE